jgi:hypothetical protein
MTSEGHNQGDGYKALPFDLEKEWVMESEAKLAEALNEYLITHTVSDLLIFISALV